MTNSPRGARRTSAGPPSALSRPVRRTVLVVHVVASAGWLGLSVCLLALALAGLADGPATTQATAYRAMDLFGDWLVAPFALVTLASGLVLSLGTHWGLAKHRWVYTKFWLTLIAATASFLALRPALDEAAAAVGTGEPVDSVGLLFPPSVSLSLYVFMTAISLLKPWGPTRRGRKARAARTSGTHGYTPRHGQPGGAYSPGRNLPQ